LNFWRSLSPSLPDKLVTRIAILGTLLSPPIAPGTATAPVSTATTAAPSAPATAVPAAPAAAASSSGLPLARHVDAQVPAFPRLAVEGLDRRRPVFHLDEGEAAGTTRVAVHHDGDRVHLTMLGE
jgi:hypothetical protein